jgi:ATP-dependent DNA helicase RecG
MNLGYKNHFDNHKRYLEPILNNYLIEMTIPDKPKSKNQKYQLTDKGKQTLEMIRRNKLPKQPL